MLQYSSGGSGAHPRNYCVSHALPASHSVPGSRPRWLVVSLLGFCQILAWGSSYYLPAVLAVPIERSTGWPAGWVVGGLSIGFLVSGVVSPQVGRKIDRFGGRPVLAASAALLAVGLCGLALAPNLPAYLAAWVLIGAGMGCGLYDPVFSTLGRTYGEAARPLITGVTLWGGFASTVCWPLSAYFTDSLGWRGACLAYAAIQFAVALPLYFFGLPREGPRNSSTPVRSPDTMAPGHLRSDQRSGFILLATGFTLASVIMTVISVHLLALLEARGLALAAAVGFGALVGPSQVGARVFEMAFGRKLHPVWSLLASAVMVVVGLGMLLGAPGLIGTGIVLYGSGSGIRSIARGTVPLAMFGREGYAVLMGRIAMPTLIAQAASPLLGSWLLQSYGPTWLLAVLSAAALVNVVLVVALLPHCRTASAHS